jgi:hypothetical protein
MATVAKQSNPFQRMIHKIEEALANEELTVTETSSLWEYGDAREVDVFVEGIINGRRVRVAIECRGLEAQSKLTGKSRKNYKEDISWIDALIGKYYKFRGEVTKIIAVSERGFSRLAKEKAKDFNITLLTVQEASEADWPKITRPHGVFGDVNKFFLSFSIFLTDGTMLPFPVSNETIIPLLHSGNSYLLLRNERDFLLYSPMVGDWTTEYLSIIKDFEKTAEDWALSERDSLRQGPQTVSFEGSMAYDIFLSEIPPGVHSYDPKSNLLRVSKIGLSIEMSAVNEEEARFKCYDYDGKAKIAEAVDKNRIVNLVISGDGSPHSPFILVDGYRIETKVKKAKSTS